MTPIITDKKSKGATKAKTDGKAVVLLSGGLDSATVLAIAALTRDCYALSFDYGQRQKRELECAKKIAAEYQAKEHLILRLDLDRIGGSALTSDLAVPKDGVGAGIPVTYVPARNTILLAHALAWAEVLGAEIIFIGINAVDYSGYPDCRPAFLRAFKKMANLGTKVGIEGKKIDILAPFLEMSKAEIIRTGTTLGVNYSLTHSCYDPVNELACGRCDSCRLRLKGFQEAGLKDPIAYVDNVGDKR
ncbi:MAG: 7-cyano-7-deazaguanine synthase QueC [Desulfobulbaceae bacterium]|jgi:7-cyano-7-deazaguanine synthase|nr:7-cyano-7-deazaguanine synthase QueC [Desulfobulbaceae bacterium]